MRAAYPAATAGDGGPPLTVGLYSPGWPPVHFANGVRPNGIKLRHKLG